MAAKRELIAPNGNKRYRYVRRDRHGRFTTDQVDVGRALAEDRRHHAKTVAPRGQGDRGDRGRPLHRAPRSLGMRRETLWKKLRALGLVAPEPDDET